MMCLVTLGSSTYIMLMSGKTFPSNRPYTKEEQKDLTWQWSLCPSQAEVLQAIGPIPVKSKKNHHSIRYFMRGNKVALQYCLFHPSVQTANMCSNEKRLLVKKGIFLWFSLIPPLIE